MVSLISLGQKKELTTKISKDSHIDSATTANTSFIVEFANGNTKRGRLVTVDDEDQVIVLGNSSDTTEIDFKKVYKINEDGTERNAGLLYRIDAPERFFYTPMGNTMEKGTFALEDFFFLNAQLKYAPTNNLELGVGLTLWPNETPEDTNISTFVMASVKYKVLDRRHLKVAVGVETIQMPPTLLFAAGQNPVKPPWFNLVYASANWEYKYMTFAFSTAQAYLNSFPLRQAPDLFNSDRGIDYMMSASASVKIFPFLHAISENIYFAGAWNVLGNQNTIDKVNLFMPLVGGRYYGEYYSFAGGVSNVIIPNAIFFFYLGGSYYFR